MEREFQQYESNRPGQGRLFLEIATLGLIKAEKRPRYDQASVVVSDEVADHLSPRGIQLIRAFYSSEIDTPEVIYAISSPEEEDI